MSKAELDGAPRTRRGVRFNIPMIQNVLLVWLDGNIDDNDNDHQNTITQLRRVVNSINTFTDGEECIEFLEVMAGEKACMIISGYFGQRIVPRIHDLAQVDSIFIFCGNKHYHEGWAKGWPKIKGVFNEIQRICDALKQAAQQCEQNAISISIMDAGDDLSKKNLDQLDPSFMYTQIMKEIFLTIKYEPQHIDEFIQHCREVLADNAGELENVEQLARNYNSHTPIWWYTCECFLYPMLNRALRTMDTNTMIKLGFFINDLHRQIEQLHEEQFNRHGSNECFTVYRGQGMDKAAFKKMAASKGGLISFNCFLSTSENREISLRFAKGALANSQMVGVLFVMTIDPDLSETSFASVIDVGSFGATEDEVLFSMHTVFRIGQVTPMDDTSRLVQVELTLTSDKDNDLHELIDHIRQETFPDKEGWFRLGLVLEKVGQLVKAQQIFEVLLGKARDEDTKASIYHQLGLMKDKLGKHGEAIAYYEKSIEIEKTQTRPNYQNIAKSYNEIGWVYFSMGDYIRALEFYEKALEIRQNSLPPTHPDIASSYNRLGIVYLTTDDYSKSLSSFEKALEIRQQSLPPTHPDLAASYSNIGMIKDSMCNYSEALSSYEKALEIQQQSLPPTHPDLAMSYNNIGNAYHGMGDYARALSSHEKALAIKQQSLPATHIGLATCYECIGNVNYGMDDHENALLSYEKALEIRQQSLPPTHPDLATSHNNIALVYKSMGDYSKALSSHEKALAIKQQAFSPNHSSLAMTYFNMGLVHENMDHCSEAQSCFKRAVDIAEHSLPSNHPHLERYRNKLAPKETDS